LTVREQSSKKLCRRSGRPWTRDSREVKARPAGRFFIALLAFLAAAGLLLGGCGGREAKSSRFKGVVKVSGSTTVLPVALEGATEFMDANPGANIQVQGGGSSVGITQVRESVVQIGDSSRDLKGDENDGTLVDHKIAFDIVGIVVNPGVPVSNLSSEQVKGVFTGSINNWKEVGGLDAPIIVVVRDIASGTREVFDQKALGSTTEKPVESEESAIESSSNGVVREIVGATANSIGYISTGYINRLVKPIAYNGVPPDVAHARNGEYPIARFLHMFTKGQPAGATRGYIDFMLSDVFQNSVIANEYVPIKQVQIR
jgi:phosphate transport system substrate-binding protein